MSDFNRNPAVRGGFGADRAVAIDAGLRAYMIRVYNYMAIGVGADRRRGVARRSTRPAATSASRGGTRWR